MMDLQVFYQNSVVLRNGCSGMLIGGSEAFGVSKSLVLTRCALVRQNARSDREAPPQGLMFVFSLNISIYKAIKKST